MRDLNLEQHRVPNGDGPSVLDGEIEPSAAESQSMRTRQRVVRRDQKLAEIAVLMIDTTRMIEPVVTMIGGRVLRWATLGVAATLAFHAMQAPTWERAAIAGGFMLLSPLLWWKV